MTQKPIQSHTHLSQLLLFENNFLSLVHSQVYHTQKPFNQSFIKFEINHLSDINQKFTRTLGQLIDQLVLRKKPYQLSLRDSFQKLLKVSYLSLLRVNRYDLTKLSLYGFDIYIEPLEAVLQILSRIDDIKRNIVRSTLVLQQNQNGQSAIEKGWDHFCLYSEYWKLSLNLYMLKQYLAIGGKSFVRKDRQIVFTGINNLYTQLIPALLNKNGKMLNELTELNNSLYYFHQSFDIFQFYTLLLPLKSQYQPLFAFLKEILQKCLNANIVTPLLFGIIRHRDAFLKFIEQADQPIWLPYVNTILSGIAINLKFRILQYEQILQIFEAVAQRAGLLGTIRTTQMVGQIDKQWKDAKQFFISAVKMGFSNGQVQTWKTVDFKQIGTSIIQSTLKGMLLNPDQNKQSLDAFLQQPQELLNSQILELTLDKFDYSFVQKSTYELDRTLSTSKQVQNLFRIVNLIRRVNQCNQYVLHFVLSAFLKLEYQFKNVYQKRLDSVTQKVNQLIYNLVDANLSSLRQKITNFHLKFSPKNNFTNIIELYFKQLQTKTCLTNLLQILPLSDQNCVQIFVIQLATKKIQKPGNKIIKLRTFDKEMLVKNDLINPPYETQCIVRVLSLALKQNKPYAQNILQKLSRACPWIGFVLLNFPIAQQNSLQSFASYLMSKTEYHQLLFRLITLTRGSVLTQQGIDLISAIVCPGICDQLIKLINDQNNLDQLYHLCKLLLKIGSQVKQKSVASKQLLLVLLHLLEKSTNTQRVIQIIYDITGNAQLFFQDKLEICLANLLSRKIQGKSQLGTSYRKTVLKNSSNSFYFLSQFQNKQKQQGENVIYQKQQVIVNCLREALLNSSKQKIHIFQQQLKKLSVNTLISLNQIVQNKDLATLEGVKHFQIPQISKQILKELLQKYQQNQLVLTFLGLNIENYAYLVQTAIQTKNIAFLSKNRFVKSLNNKIGQLLTLQIQTNTPILKKMSAHLSIQQKIRISQQFFIQSSMFEPYCKCLQNIEYFTVFNSSNWRLLIEYFTKELSIISLPSVLLQYTQFVAITSQKNKQYQKIISKQGALLSSFISLFLYKIDAIFTLSTSQEQLSIRSTNQLSSLNLIFYSLQLKDVLSRMSALHRSMKERKIQIDNFWIDNLTKLNKRVNQLFEGDIIVPDFSQGFSLTNSKLLHQDKVQLGAFLQNYYQSAQISIDKTFLYIPKLPSNLSLQQFIANSKIRQIINKSSIKVLQIKNHYQKTIEKAIQKGLIQKVQRQIKFISNYNQQIQEQNILLIYRLGCLHATIPKNQRKQLHSLIQSCLNRTKISWQQLKNTHSEQYHLIKSLLAENNVKMHVFQLSQRNLTFTFNGAQLIPNGQNIKVNSYNRDLFCNKLALQVLGQKQLRLIQAFIRGYLYQSSQQ